MLRFHGPVNSPRAIRSDSNPTQSWEPGKFVTFDAKKAYEMRKETLVKTFQHMPVRYIPPGRNGIKIPTGYHGKIEETCIRTYLI